jgi:hypothetical protein
MLSSLMLSSLTAGWQVPAAATRVNFLQFKSTFTWLCSAASSAVVAASLSCA